MTELSESSTLLRAGDPRRKAIAIFYDSKVGTHSEYLNVLGVKQIFDRLPAYEVLLVDLATQSAEDIAASESFVKAQLGVDLAKVGLKTNPSIFVQVNDSLHKVKTECLQDMAKFNTFIDRVSKVRLAASIADIVTALKANNRALDSLTIVYCTNGTNDQERSKLEQKALRLLAHES